MAVYGCLEQNVPGMKPTSTSVNRTYWASTTVTTGRTLASYVKVSPKSGGPFTKRSNSLFAYHSKL